MVKRLLDILCSLILLAALAVPMLLVALVIRLGSAGPAIFLQRRAGRHGKPFIMLKFRTMRTDVDAYAPSPHAGDDPRLTRTGRFLRETSVDEWPQLFNVLAGQMSLVGPRPLYERQAEQWTPRQRQRLDVRPGLTGYAQAFGRGALTIEDKIELDLYYVEHQGVWIDVKIVLRTVANMFTRRSAEIYERRYSKDRQQEGDDRSGPTE